MGLPPASSPRRRSPPPAGGLTAALLGLLGAICVLAIWYFVGVLVPREREGLVEQWRDRLTAMADDRRALVERWVAGRIEDARIVASYPTVRDVLDGQGARPTSRFAEGGPADHLRGVLRGFANLSGYRGISVLDTEDHLVARSDGGPFPQAGCLEAPRAVREGSPGAIVFHLHDGAPIVAVAVPVTAHSRGGLLSKARPSGAVLLEVDPATWLYPLLKTEPIPTSTGETILVRREGETILYLSPLRHHAGAPHRFRHSLDLPGLAAERALAGPAGFSSYVDYRGIPVYAAVRRVEGTGWGLVVKVDRDEALASLGSRVRGTAVAGAAVVLALLGVGWGLWRGQRARYEVSLARSEAESEARFRSLIESAPVAISIVRSGEILYANPACIRLFGHERLEDFEGRPVLSHMAPESHPQLTERRRRRERGEAIPSVFETMGRRRDGSPLPLLVEVADLQLPDGLATLVFLRDMTELRRAELERRRLAAAIEQSAETVVITDAEGTIEYVNPAFERITGYSREEALGQNPRLLKSGNHAPEFYREMWSTLLRGEAWSGRLVNKRRDGTLYEEEATISPVRDESGRIAHFVAVKRDVTERQRLEARLLQAQKMESVGRLAGGVAHDFNNLLSVILGYTGLILRRLPEPDPLRPRITEIHKAGERAAALTRQLLAFSRRQVLQPVVMDLNATVENLEKMLRRLIGEDIDLSTLLDRRAGLIRADPSQVEQVIVNLAVNARDAMPRGGRLTIETAPAVLDEAYTSARPGVRPGRHVALVVSDNGSGMDAETQAHLFEPFFTTKEQGKGTGLGLATVYGIVEQSGGHITFESRVDHGTTFRIYFPRVEGEAAFVAGPPPAEDEARGTETVLIVEDEEMLRDFAVQVLRLHGYQVLEAADGADALRLLERHPEAVDLVVTDVVMPRMSGPELAHRLTRKRPGVKVLFLSGYAGPDIAQHGLPEAGSAFLAKPFTPDALARKVREVLDEPSGSGSLTPSDPRP